MTINELINSRRKAAGIPTAELARRLGLVYNDLCGIFLDRRNPTPAELLALLDYFEIDLQTAKLCEPRKTARNRKAAK